MKKIFKYKKKCLWCNKSFCTRMKSKLVCYTCLPSKAVNNTEIKTNKLIKKKIPLYYEIENE